MKWIRNKKVMISLALGIVAAIGWQYTGSNGSEEEVVYTEVEYTVQQGSIRIDFEGDGDVELSTLNLDFEVSGTVAEILIEEGDHIEEGQVVARLDDNDYQTAYLKAKSSYNQALLTYEDTIAQDSLNQLSRNETLVNLQLEMEQAKMDYERNLQLEGIVSAQETEDSRVTFEKAKLAYETQKQTNVISTSQDKSIQLAQSNVEIAELSLLEAEENLHDTELVSPASGKVMSLNFSVGEAFTSPKDNSSASEHFVVLLDSNEVEVISPISEIDIESVFEGQEVEIIFEAYPSKTYHGVVKRIEDIPTSESGLVTYDAILEMTDADEAVKDGMTCEISFILSQRQNVFLIPNKAVAFTDGSQYVKVMLSDGTVEERVISTGLTDGRNVEVTKGLSEGDTLVYETLSKE